ncbi:MAG TPA: Trk system potassium transporter TrkA [Rhizobiales bacterium]|nr:Trk system potassium transporter TrkA [Hyphomicrobiales bacterium]
MKIIICGAGQVGRGIAERLALEENDVTLIDTSDELIQLISSSQDIQGIVGHGAHPDVLERAGAEDADMIIAATFVDEVNMMACEVANAIFEVPTKIARVRAQAYLAPEYSQMFSSANTAIDVIISPEIAVGETVLRRLALPGAFEAIYFVDEKVIAIGISLRSDCPIVNTPLSQLTDLFPDLNAVVVAVVRDGSTFVPHSDEQLLPEDQVFVIADQSQAVRVLSLFGHNERPPEHVIIGGGGNIGLYVAEKLEERNSKIKIRVIEASEPRAEFVSERLRRAMVLHGSVLDDEILREAGIHRADAFIAVTDDDKVNILASMMAKQQGALQAMSLVTGLEISSLRDRLGLDAFIDPRNVTMSSILKHARRGRIRGVHPILGGDGEIVEADVLETSPMIGNKLRDTELPEGVRIGAIVRDDKVIMPTGDTEIKANDRVVLFAMADQVQDLQHLFRVSLEYF